MSNARSRPATPPTMAGSFDEVVLPHLDDAYRLARWLVRNEHDAEDVVQEASLRALRYFRTFTGGNGRAWFLSIVRNVCRGWRGHHLGEPTDPFDEEQHSGARPSSDPETLALHIDDARLIEQTARDLADGRIVGWMEGALDHERQQAHSTVRACLTRREERL